ncbi:MAG: hypothetical protein E7582_03780 [Ruminococcaceae bacterium]|nr:hypothetical protein [Oscillospiraceae bacterium]
MYSRKTGIMYNPSQTQKKIEQFNENLRVQYNNRNSFRSPEKVSEIKEEEISDTVSVDAATEENDTLKKIFGMLNNEDIILVILIMLLLFEVNKDYLLIGILAILLFLD